MYEAEVNRKIERIDSLPADIRKRFAEYRGRIISRTTLPWGEHCTECAWPTCYTSCDLYSPREDGACRQFIDGVIRIDHPEGLSPYLQKIRFKQWGKLWTVGNLYLKPQAKADSQERLNIAVGAVSRNVPLPAPLKRCVLTKISYTRRRSAENAPVIAQLPDYFLLECYNPNSRTIALTLTFRSAFKTGVRQFQNLISVPVGYTRAQIPFSDISQALDMGQPFEVEIVPNNCENTELYFGLIDFVTERADNSTSGHVSTKKCKCIVWDLDNTLWDGILLEDGPDKIRVRQSVADIIKETDQRGILHSVASKNNHEDAMQVLRRAGIDEYFLFPQIQWQPKSQSIGQIAQSLNIGVDAIMFVDDQAFEREEVHSVLPEVTIIDASDHSLIPNRPECDVPVTAESSRRRLMYREQQNRSAVSDSYGANYIGFLKDCALQLELRPLDQVNLKRVYELTQRTNQLNFSGNRYTEQQLREIMGRPFLETYVAECSDRFGHYGIIGFAIVDKREPYLADLMFSCRVQSKRVEHAVLAFLLDRFVRRGNRDLRANYRRTSKNAACGKVFEEMGFECVGENGGVLSFVFRSGQEILDDGIIAIKQEGVLAT